METVASSAWYAVRVHTRQELLLGQVLQYKGYETLVPTYTETRSRARKQHRVLPLFPSYVFCRFDKQVRLPILVTPGVVHILGDSQGPLPVDDDEIAALRLVTQMGLPCKPQPVFERGACVYIQHGPLTGLYGIVVASNKHQRVILNVTLLQRSVAVEVDSDALELITDVSPTAHPC
ncbi:MAG: transcription termination/antitermination protein NusG [Bryobacteraceae bacterium]